MPEDKWCCCPGSESGDVCNGEVDWFQNRFPTSAQPAFCFTTDGTTTQMCSASFAYDTEDECTSACWAEYGSGATFSPSLDPSPWGDTGSAGDGAGSAGDGACCPGEGQGGWCYISDQISCNDAGNIWHGAGTICENVDCWGDGDKWCCAMESAGVPVGLADPCYSAPTGTCNGFWDALHDSKAECEANCAGTSDDRWVCNLDDPDTGFGGGDCVLTPEPVGGWQFDSMSYDQEESCLTVCGRYGACCHPDTFASHTCSFVSEWNCTQMGSAPLWQGVGTTCDNPIYNNPAYPEGHIGDCPTGGGDPPEPTDPGVFLSDQKFGDLSCGCDKYLIGQMSSATMGPMMGECLPKPPPPPDGWGCRPSEPYEYVDPETGTLMEMELPPYCAQCVGFGDNANCVGADGDPIPYPFHDTFEECEAACVPPPDLRYYCRESERPQEHSDALLMERSCAHCELKPWGCISLWTYDSVGEYFDGYDECIASGCVSEQPEPPPPQGACCPVDWRGVDCWAPNSGREGTMTEDECTTYDTYQVGGTRWNYMGDGTSCFSEPDLCKPPTGACCVEEDGPGRAWKGVGSFCQCDTGGGCGTEGNQFWHPEDYYMRPCDDPDEHPCTLRGGFDLQVHGDCTRSGHSDEEFEEKDWNQSCFTHREGCDYYIRGSFHVGYQPGANSTAGGDGNPVKVECSPGAMMATEMPWPYNQGGWVSKTWEQPMEFATVLYGPRAGQQVKDATWGEMTHNWLIPGQPLCGPAQTEMKSGGKEAAKNGGWADMSWQYVNNYLSDKYQTTIPRDCCGHVAPECDDAAVLTTGRGKTYSAAYSAGPTNDRPWLPPDFLLDGAPFGELATNAIAVSNYCQCIKQWEAAQYPEHPGYSNEDGCLGGAMPNMNDYGRINGVVGESPDYPTPPGTTALGQWGSDGFYYEYDNIGVWHGVVLPNGWKWWKCALGGGSNHTEEECLSHPDLPPQHSHKSKYNQGGWGSSSELSSGPERSLSLYGADLDPGTVSTPAGTLHACQPYQNTCGKESYNCGLIGPKKIKKGKTYVLEGMADGIDKFDHLDHWWEWCFEKCKINVPDLPEELDRLIKPIILDRLNVSGTPYAAVAITIGEELVYENYYSARNAQALGKSPVGRIASLGKAICGAAIGTLYGKGWLNPSDKLVAILPEYFYDANGDPLFVDSRYEQITVDHLANHQGGWNRIVAPAGWLVLDHSGLLDDTNFIDFQIARDLAGMFPDEYPDGVKFPLEMKHLIQWENQRSLDFDPGTARGGGDEGYSNYGYALLAEIIMKTTGQKYSTYVKDEIFEPLGIEMTHTSLSDKESTGPNAHGNEWPYILGEETNSTFDGYCDADGCDDLVSTYWPYYAWTPRPGGGGIGWLSTVGNYAKFLTLFGNTKESTDILSSATKTLMFSRRAYHGTVNPYYAYGQELDETKNGAYHDGVFPGTQNSFARYFNSMLCNQPMSIVVFLNAQPVTTLYARSVVDAIEAALLTIPVIAEPAFDDSTDFALNGDCSPEPPPPDEPKYFCQNVNSGPLHGSVERECTGQDLLTVGTCFCTEWFPEVAAGTNTFSTKQECELACRCVDPATGLPCCIDPTTGLPCPVVGGGDWWCSMEWTGEAACSEWVGTFRPGNIDWYPSQHDCLLSGCGQDGTTVACCVPAQGDFGAHCAQVSEYACTSGADGSFSNGAGSLCAYLGGQTMCD